MSIKVFDLIPVVQKLDNLRTSQIECFHYSNTLLCIGTNDGHILRYSINKSNYLGENVGFKSVLIDSKQTSQKKPINLITIIPDLQRIIYLSDGLLNSINFDDLQPSQSNALKLKNVTTYCFSDKYDEKVNMFGSDEASILCVCIKSKTLQIYAINGNSVTLYKEVALPELCLQIEINKHYICVASDNSYMIVNMFNSTIQTLFSYDIEQLSPFITNHIEGEFLLNCQGDLGMFATFDGQTTRPPVPWCKNCTQFQIFNPYVLCLSNETVVKIYNLTDLKIKQEIQINGPVKRLKYVNEDKFLFVSTSTQMFILNRTSMLFQVEQLLIRKQTDEAINLFEVLSINLNKSDYEEQIQKIKIKSAFIELTENLNYAKSETLFLEANFDYKALVKMLPGFKLKTGAETNEDYIEKYRPIFSEDKLDQEKLTSVKKLLINMMLKSKRVVKDEEFVSILFRLCIFCNDPSLNKIDFFSTLPVNFCLQNIHILNENKRFHSVAVIYYLVDQYDSAFEIWKNICDKKLVDEHFPGFTFFVDQLAKCRDHQLVWKYVDWAMQVDQAVAVEVFTKRSTDELASERMRVDNVLDCLQNYKLALTIYLEFIIHVKNIKKEKYTTQLVSIYLENIIDLLKIPTDTRDSEWQSNLDKSRLKFQTIIESPIVFRVQVILVKIKDYENNLQKECAILYGRIEEHEKALKILVYTLGDYKAAINYCLNNSRDSVKVRRNLFNTLFSIYTNPSYPDKDKLVTPTLELLNSKLISNFDIPKLIEMVPSNWSMKLTGEFLQNALNTTLAKKRNDLAQKDIALCHKFELQTTLFSLKKVQLYVDDDLQCFKCHKSLDCTSFVRHPNGKLSHKICKVEVKNKRFEY